MVQDPILSVLVAHANNISTAVLLSFILYGGWRRWWVWGWAYRDVADRLIKTETDRDEWKFMALTGTKTAHSAVTLAEQGIIEKRTGASR